MGKAISWYATVVGMLVGFVVGYDLGVKSERKALRTDCKRQQDERELLTTVQYSDHVVCIYSTNGYGLAKKRRKAS